MNVKNLFEYFSGVDLYSVLEYREEDNRRFFERYSHKLISLILCFNLRILPLAGEFFTLYELYNKNYSDATLSLLGAETIRFISSDWLGEFFLNPEDNMDNWYNCEICKDCKINKDLEGKIK